MANDAGVERSADHYSAGGAARTFGSVQIWDVSWARLWRTSALLTIPAIALVQLAAEIVGHDDYGGDFRAGILPAGRAVLNGSSPYPAANAHRLLVLLHSFVTPPPLAMLAAPLSVLPFPPAVALWNLTCATALILALRVMGVRNKWIYLLAVCSFPFFDSLENGQPDGLFALAAALAWRYRDSWQGALAAAFLIAAKLLAWPLLIWMLATKRIRSFKITVGTTVLLLSGTWAVIGFKGLAQYPSLMAADAKAFEAFPTSSSLVQALSPLGLSIADTRILGVLIALALSATIVVLSRGSDEGWFSGALTFGLLCSPIVWLHYVVVLFVPLAFARRRPVVMWAVIAYSNWFILFFLVTPGTRAIAMTAMMVGSVMWATMEPLSVADGRALSKSAY